jgi:hypothetical protein
MSAISSKPEAPIGPQGTYWQDNLYLTSTSEVDGQSRWQTIILLLADKVRVTAEITEIQQPELLPFDSHKSQK